MYYAEILVGPENIQCKFRVQRKQAAVVALRSSARTQASTLEFYTNFFLFAWNAQQIPSENQSNRKTQPWRVARGLTGAATKFFLKVRHDKREAKDEQEPTNRIR